MANSHLIKNATVISDYKQFVGDVYIKHGRIEQIDSQISRAERINEIDGEGLWLMPGVIDDQVHFREPGLTHKASIASESRAAVLGGVTSYMEMPNTNPATLTIELLEEKYQIAKQNSWANYSFFFGASNDNIEQIKRLKPHDTCGVKIFMGSSTGNMLVDSESALADVFRFSPMLIATHCEEESIIVSNKQKYHSETNPQFHPIIRSREACIASSEKAIALAKKYDARLHILHISTKEEVQLFETIPLRDKKITAEACVHHLWFSDEDYQKYGNQIVCNPAIKTAEDRAAIWQGVIDGRIDVIATDHAPHTLAEKEQVYPKCPSGVPLVQHSLLMMLEKVREKKISLEMMVDKMCHKPAELFQIKDRGYIREGYMADLVLIDSRQTYEVNSSNIAYQCGWSPFLHYRFSHLIDATFVNGVLMQKNGLLVHDRSSQRLEFNR